MRVNEPVRVEVQHFVQLFNLGIVVSSEHPQIVVGALVFTSPVPDRKPDVFTPMMFSSSGQVYYADYSPLRRDQEEVRRMYFIRRNVGAGEPEKAA